MSDLPKKAKVVIIGAGIVGNSVVYHLARLGWKEMVLVDKGPLPNPGERKACTQHRKHLHGHVYA